MPVLTCCLILSLVFPGVSKSQSTSLYSSTYVAVTSKAALDGAECTRSKSSTARRGTIPSCVGVPMMLWLLPLPVCPYAKIVPL